MKKNIGYRILCRLFEAAERLDQKSAIPATGSVRMISTSNTLDACAIKTAIDAFSEPLEEAEECTVLVGVGKNLTRHSHLFSIFSNPNNTISMRYIDPEGYIGRRSPHLAENSQILSLDINIFTGDYSLKYARFSVNDASSAKFRAMKQLQDVCQRFSETAQLLDDNGTEYDRKIYALIDETQAGATIHSSHFLSEFHGLARKYQVRKVLEYAIKLAGQGHFRPLDEKHFHCEVSASCVTPV